MENLTHEPSACKIRRFKMMKYSFEADEEYVAIKEHEHIYYLETNMEARHAYRELFRKMDDGWIDYIRRILGFGIRRIDLAANEIDLMDCSYLGLRKKYCLSLKNDMWERIFDKKTKIKLKRTKPSTRLERE
ncbi:hypothetical protein Tco_0439722 [Tanacetum coccineum]